MITKIEISALKSIDNLKMDCTKLNVITGINSSGKSTILQAILLFYQSNLRSEDMSYLSGLHKLYPLKCIDDFATLNGLNGELILMGDFRENKNINLKDKKISISICFDDYTGYYKSMYITEADGHNDMIEHDEWIEYPYKVSSDEFAEDQYNGLKYLSCNRIGAKDVYEKNHFSSGIGQNGEYAIHYLEQNKSIALDENLRKDTNSHTLLTQVNYWLKYIVGSSIDTENIKGTDIVKASYMAGENRFTRPRNVGSGVSYLISVLILCLASEKNDILMIENPEIHLHPRAQSKVCEFLYFIAKAGRQIFVETHSDHIFNGIRAGIATDEINKDDVSLNYFELDERGCTKNTVIEFGERGRILNGTDGLFDQFDIDLTKMLKL